MRSGSVVAIVSLFAWLAGAPALAQEQSATAEPAEQIDPAWEAANQALIEGPTNVSFRDQASIALPDGYGFVPREQATAVMEQMGNTVGDNFLGLIFPLNDENWFVSVDWEPSGYIKDDDAKEWDAEELLQSLKDGTEAGNEHRAKMGVPPIQVTRWVETPSYDATAHQLVWSAEARLKDGDDPDPTINYNTYVLGREGYVSMNLITTSSQVESNKPAARQLLSAVTFVDGKRYGDFNPDTDKVAAYGLAALIGGVAAKKLGLLAAIGVFLAKFGKLLAVGAVAIGAGIFKRFKKQPTNA